jgi:hypothetical protein
MAARRRSDRSVPLIERTQRQAAIAIGPPQVPESCAFPIAAPQPDDDGCIHAKFFGGGSGAKVDLFMQWLAAVKGSTQWVNVHLVEPVASLVCWLANEKTNACFPLAQATKDFYRCRAPTALQLDTVQALWHAFLRDVDGWHAWEYVGRITRAIPDKELLDQWRKIIAQGYPRIAQFHAEVRAAFYKAISTREGAYLKFEGAKHQAFVDGMLHDYQEILSGVVALAVNEQLPGAVIARFDNWIIAEREPKRTLSPASLSEEVAKVFPGSHIQLEVT